MAFRTKLDYSDGRQIKQREGTLTQLSGGTVFGVEFEELTSGPDLSTSALTEDYYSVVSTFSGDSQSTVINWYDSRMELLNDQIIPLTPSNSATTQELTVQFTPENIINVDGNEVNLTYMGVEFNLTVTSMSVNNGEYTGTIEHDTLYFYSADTLDYTGRTIWVDNTEITRTDRLIIKNEPQVGHVFTCIDSEGMGAWLPGGTGGNSLWEYSNGILSLVPINSTNIASGDNSFAIGSGTQALGDNSYAQGLDTIASGNSAHAEGVTTQALGDNSHAQGSQTIADSTASHAQGAQSRALNIAAHAQGFDTLASGEAAHSQGARTQAIGNNSHSEGQDTIASGNSSHAEGRFSKSIGISSHAQGFNTRAFGDFSHTEGDSVSTFGLASHAEGAQTIAYGDLSHVQGFRTEASGFTAHAEGFLSKANGDQSHVGGFNSTVESETGFIHSRSSLLTINAINSAILGGVAITGDSANTVYVPDLIIDGLTSVTDLQTDADGRLVDGVSDVSLKENIKTIESALGKIKKLRGVSFDWTEESNMGEGINFGLIAQEVNEVIPEMVKTIRKNEGKLTLDYKSIIPWLIEAIKELSSDDLESNTIIKSQTITSEDNNIILNFNGTHKSSLNGGIVVNKGINSSDNSQFIINSDGDWFTNNYIIPYGLTIPEYTPTSSYDDSGKIGEITRDDNHIYIKTNDGWKRTNLSKF